MSIYDECISNATGVLYQASEVESETDKAGARTARAQTWAILALAAAVHELAEAHRDVASGLEER